MIPRTEDVLRSAVWTLEQDIAPHVEDELAASLIRSVTFLLHHAIARTEHEEAGLAEDNADLRDLLERIRKRLGDAAPELPSPDAADTGRRIDALITEAISLRHLLEDLQHQLDVDDGSHAPELRDGINAYLRRHLAREARWMAPAFEGPRR